tara:strand:- start:48 stop:377 length:330 start_codon:yes stop_codon:yes gene_type:complete
MRGRGRPCRSVIRQNMVEILQILGQAHGYHIAKIYNEIFPPVTQRSIYYHLRKGVETREFLIQEVVEEEGDFSWGSVVQKIYYELGNDAEPIGNGRVKKFLTKNRHLVR